MQRRLAVAVSVATVAALGFAPAHAATKKPKPKPIHGSYTLSLLPDPTIEVLEQVKDGCAAVAPQGVNNHPFKVPAAGTLHVVLDSPDPTGAPGGVGGTDWDLYLIDTDGSVFDSSAGGTSHEETTDKFKKGQPLTFQVCNLLGEPNATVTYTFTYA